MDLKRGISLYLGKRLAWDWRVLPGVGTFPRKKTVLLPGPGTLSVRCARGGHFSSAKDGFAARGGHSQLPRCPGRALFSAKSRFYCPGRALSKDRKTAVLFSQYGCVIQKSNYLQSSACIHETPPDGYHITCTTLLYRVRSSVLHLSVPAELLPWSQLL